MRIGKPLLIVSTLVGLVGGLREAHRVAGGLVFLMLAMICVLGAGVGILVAAVRRERLMQQGSNR